MKTETQILWLFFWKKKKLKEPVNPRKLCENIMEDAYEKKIRESLLIVIKEFAIIKRISINQNIQFIDQMVNSAIIHVPCEGVMEIDMCVKIAFKQRFDLYRNNCCFTINRVVLYKKKSVVYYNSYNPNYNKRNNQEESFFDLNLF